MDWKDEAEGDDGCIGTLEGFLRSSSNGSLSKSSRLPKPGVGIIATSKVLDEASGAVPGGDGRSW